MRDKLKKSWLLNGLIGACLLALPAGATAQKKPAKTAVKPDAQVAAATSAKNDVSATAVDDPAQFRQEFIAATENYKNSLAELSQTYQATLQRLTEQAEKLQKLYTEGLIARREVEKSAAEVDEARAKLNGARAQLAETETLLAAARQPLPPPAAGVDVSSATTARAAAPAWTTGAQSVDNLIRYYGAQYGVDPYLIYCVMHQESRFGAGATSNKGAMGLMQLMPGTAARYGVTNAYDPAQNIMGGARYLRDLLRLFGGRIDLVLAGYNAGEGAVMKFGNRVPPYAETRNYVNVIGARYGRTDHVAQPAAIIKPVAPKKNVSRKRK